MKRRFREEVAPVATRQKISDGDKTKVIIPDDLNLRGNLHLPSGLLLSQELKYKARSMLASNCEQRWRPQQEMLKM